ncbi:flippase [Mucilaginibacter glaciei]|uniref:Flippase n=1 Tax=Mucilaginibacter glaciei TaxID=2772109 RepID=A0A926NHT1_9SPHI|nr:flippase [Mucilaginibacter glaciei]MBD1392324.1 flippase [Mucilaginibacter glaciei]
MSEIKKNFLFNLLLTLSNIIFPIITFPYVSRILGPAGVGKIQFITTFVQYFVLIAALGIPIYGIREIAKLKGDEEGIKKTFSELLFLNLLTSFILFFVYSIIIFTVPSLYIDLKFYAVAVIILLLSFSNVDWLFSGLEKFKFIAIRSIIVKFVSLLLLIFFVKQKSDVVIYLWTIVIASVSNNILNIYSARKMFKFNYATFKGIKDHLKPLFYIFSTVAGITVYAMLDTIILGFLTNYTYVGYYTAASRINKLTLPVLTSLGTVLVPQISEAIKNDNLTQVKKLAVYSFNFVLLLGIPMTVGLIVLAPELIVIFSGIEFKPAILAMQIFAPVVLIIALSNVWAIQILTPAGKDKQVTISVTVGLIVSLILNFSLIPYFGYLGAAAANVLAELCVMVCFAYFASKVLLVGLNYKLIIQTLFVSVLFFPIIILLRMLFRNSNFLVCGVGVVTCGALFLVCQLYIFKNELLLNQINQYTAKLGLRKNNRDERPLL